MVEPAQLKSLSNDDLQAMLARLKRHAPKMEGVYPSVAFVPNRVQKNCLKLMSDGISQGCRSFGLLPGNGVGKTTLLANIIWNIADGSQNVNFDLPFIQKWPFELKELRLVCDAVDLKEMSGALWQAIDQWWPKNRYKAFKQGYDYNSAYQLPNGFSLSIRTFDQPRRFHESSTLAGVFINEPPDEPTIWQQYGARLRRGGFRALFGTVWEDSAYWIQEEIIENQRAKFCYGDLHDCCKDCYPDGHLSHKEIEEVVADYPVEVREARKTGIFTGIQAKVFNIVPEVHFVDDDLIPKELTYYSSLDPHPLRPWVYNIGGVDAEGNWWIVDEWPNEPYHKIKSDHRGITEFASIIKDMDSKWNVNRRVIDRKASAANIRRDYGSTTLRNQLDDEHGLRFDDGNVHVEGEDGGITIMKTLLRYDPMKPIDYRNRPHIFISRRCWNTCYQLQNISKKKDSSGRYTEELDDKFLDFPRNLMYMVMAGFKFKAGISDATKSEVGRSAHERRVLKLLNKRRQSKEIRDVARPIQWGNN